MTVQKEKQDRPNRPSRAKEMKDKRKRKKDQIEGVRRRGDIVNLGVMYENGEGVTQDFKEAVAWYQQAAD